MNDNRLRLDETIKREWSELYSLNNVLRTDIEDRPDMPARRSYIEVLHPQDAIQRVEFTPSLLLERKAMLCDTVLPQLTALLDGELSAGAAAEIEAHLQTCAACTATQDALAALSKDLDAWTVTAPDITRSVMQAVTDDELALLRQEMRELRAEIRQLREELAVSRLLPEGRPMSPTWFPAKTTEYARMEKNDPWNFVRS